MIRPTKMMVFDGKFHWAIGERPFLYGPFDWFYYPPFTELNSERRRRIENSLIHLNTYAARRDAPAFYDVETYLQSSP